MVAEPLPVVLLDSSLPGTSTQSSTDEEGDEKTPGMDCPEQGKENVVVIIILSLDYSIICHSQIYKLNIRHFLQTLQNNINVKNKSLPTKSVCEKPTDLNQELRARRHSLRTEKV